MNFILGIQWVVFHLGVVMSVPVVLGSALGLTGSQIGSLLQLTFLITGAGSLVQGVFGHRQMLIEGPAAPWWAAYIVLAALASGTGKSLLTVRTDIAGAMIIAGAVLAVLGALGVIRKFYRLFSCRVTGVLLLLLGLQIGGVGVKGMLGDGGAHFLIAFGVLGLVILLLFRGTKILRMSAIVIGVLIGWIIALAAGITTLPDPRTAPLFSLPTPFPWGAPTFDLGSILALTILGILLIPNMIGSIKAMEDALGEKIPVKEYDRGLVLNGFVNVGVGITGGIGTIPFVISAGLISITGIKERAPFFIASALYITMGILGPLGMMVAAVPKATASAVLVISVTALAMSGIKNITEEKIGRRENFIAGLGLLSGIGIMSVPASFFQSFPGWAAGIVSNGVIVGTLAAIVLEQILPENNH